MSGTPLAQSADRIADKLLQACCTRSSPPHSHKTVILDIWTRGDSACTFSREPSTWRARDLDGCTRHMMVSAAICHAPSGSKGFARKGTR